MDPTAISVLAVWIDRFFWIVVVVGLIAGIGLAKRNGLLPNNPFRVRGYEKFWLALISGGSQVVPTTLTILLIGWSMNLPAYIPETAAILNVISVFWTSIFAALGALFGFNTQQVDNDPPTAPRSEPQAPVPTAPPPVAAPAAQGQPAASVAQESGPLRPPRPNPQHRIGEAEPSPVEWEWPNVRYPVGAEVAFGGKIYRARAEHVSQEHLTPEQYPDLWEAVLQSEA